MKKKSLHDSELEFLKFTLGKLPSGEASLQKPVGDKKVMLNAYSETLEKLTDVIISLKSDEQKLSFVKDLHDLLQKNIFTPFDQSQTNTSSNPKSKSESSDSIPEDAKAVAQIIAGMLGAAVADVEKMSDKNEEQMLKVLRILGVDI